MKILCPLCNANANYFYEDIQRYFKCPCCYGIFTDKEQLPDSKNEKQRYEMHNDDSSDAGYRKFVSPIVKAIENDFTPSSKGLDFGAGTSAIVSVLLEEEGYIINNYDPYFHNNVDVLNKKYDYISSCEVIEHFYTPHKEFKLLKSMLKENAKLYIMTELYNEDINFSSWYYKQDSTHVFFYCKETFQWIKEAFNFSSLEISKRIVIFTN